MHNPLSGRTPTACHPGPYPQIVLPFSFGSYAFLPQSFSRRMMCAVLWPQGGVAITENMYGSITRQVNSEGGKRLLLLHAVSRATAGIL